jgi:hypothetical protein
MLKIFHFLNFSMGRNVESQSSVTVAIFFLAVWIWVAALLYEEPPKNP